MAIEFKDLDEQIKILRGRGLEIEDNYKDTAKELLLRSNYYDMVNGYGIFLQNQKDLFIKGATFNELHSIYMYDKNIRAIFFRMMVKSESFIRTTIAYHFSKNYPDSNSYLDINNFSNSTKVAKLFSNIYQTISRESGSNVNNAVSHYLKNYKEIPLWVLINFFNFGLLRTFFSLMKDADKLEIARHIDTLFEKEYGFKVNLTPKMLDSYIENINEIRNIVAHDNRLLNYETKKRAIKNKILTSPFNLNDSNYRSIFHMYLTLRLFLTREQFKNETKSLRNRTKGLKRDLKTCQIDTVLNSFGFPQDWLTKTFDELF